MKTRKSLLICSLFSVLLLACTTAFALPVPIQQGDSLTFTQAYGNTGGGVFNATVLSNGATFQTFCLEINEDVNFNNTFRVGGISSAAINGGWGGQSPVGSNSDPLDTRTAYLYTHFINGDLKGFKYGDVNSANALQRAIWYIEGEIYGDQYGVYNDFVKLADDALKNGEWYGGPGDVKVINLLRPDGTPGQDQLVMVPEPATFLVLGAGLLGLVAYRRRSRQ